MGDSAKDIYFPKEFNGRTFRYEFLQELILEELFEHVSYVKNGKISIFQNEFLGRTSILGGQICPEIESLGVLELFCTIPDAFKAYRLSFRIE